MKKTKKLKERIIALFSKLIKKSNKFDVHEGLRRLRAVGYDGSKNKCWKIIKVFDDLIPDYAIKNSTEHLSKSFSVCRSTDGWHVYISVYHKNERSGVVQEFCKFLIYSNNTNDDNIQIFLSDVYNYNNVIVHQ